MREYLIFSIAAPMASFSAQYDPGERRNSSNRPSKSGVLGMVAAALGIERTEEVKFEALRDSLGFAVRVEDAGQPAFDYHTSQVPPARRNRRFATRADELSVPKTELKTILSTREYRVNAFASPALWLRAMDRRVALADIAAALKRPHFTVYAGRKSHPLMLPCNPTVVQADCVSDAFAEFDKAQPKAVKEFRQRYLPDVQRYGQKAPPVIYSDLVEEEAYERIEQRRDLPESRTKWRFGLRQEAILSGRQRGTA
jgi:CRISPR system Cascade subunit CasD